MHKLSFGDPRIDKGQGVGRVVGRRDTWCMHGRSSTLMQTPSATDLLRAGILICQAWAGWLRAPEGSSNKHTENKEMPLVALELLRLQVLFSNHSIRMRLLPHREMQHAWRPTRRGHQLPVSIQIQARLVGNQIFAI